MCLWLTARIMRVATAVAFAAEAGLQRYRATPLTVAITKPSVEAALKIWYVHFRKQLSGGTLGSLFLAMIMGLVS